MNATDMKIYKEKANGRMSGLTADLITSGVAQNLFPHVTSSQRAAGYFDYYKTWWHLEDDADGIGIDPEVYHDYPTLSADDYVLLFTMTDRLAMADLSGYDTGVDSETKYGVAYLDVNITAGEATFDVVVKQPELAAGADLIFRDGGTIKITDKSIDTSTSGNEETHTLDGAPVVASDGVTITLTIADSAGFANSYTADGSVTRVRSIIEPSDLETSATAANVTSTAGTFDDTTYPLTLDNVGTVDQDWTLYFTDATHFRLDGDEFGTGVDTGVISSEFAPSNSVKSKPYFTIAAAAFGGTFEAGDTITFTTKPAATGIGQKRVVPAGSSSLSNNKVSQVLVVEAGT